MGIIVIILIRDFLRFAKKWLCKLDFKKSCFFALILLQACQSNSLEDFREKGRAKTKSLIVELKKIRTRDQLIYREEYLEKTFQDYSSLMNEVRDFIAKHPEIDPLPLSTLDQDLSDQVKIEILRISRLEGGEEILQRCRERLF